MKLNCGKLSCAAVTVFLFLIGAANGWSQADPSIIEPQPLTIRSTKVVEGVPASAFIGPELCDQEQNVFLRPTALSEDGAIIAKIDAGGKLVSQFDIKPTAPNVVLSSFFVNREGDVYATGHTDRQTAAEQGRTEDYVLVFAKDGILRNKVKLDANLGPTGPIAAFTSGKILVTALDGDDPEGRKAFNAIFGSDGKLVKKLTFAEDDQTARAIAQHDDSVVPDNPPLTNEAVILGTTTAGPNGTVYLIRHSNPATIYQLDDGGNVLKSFSVRSDGVGRFGAGLFESQGRLAVVFGRWGSAEAEIKVLDASSGEVVASYTDDFGGPTCFTAPAEFVMPGLEGGKLLLRRATP